MNKQFLLQANNLTQGLWMITDLGLNSLQDFTQEDERFTFEDFFTMRPEMNVDANRVANIHVKNALMRGMPKAYEKLGFITCYETLEEEIDMALEQGAKAVMLHIDSPGGMANGCIEISEKFSQLEVPTMAFISGLGCSAAYKIAAGADNIVATKSSSVGNIGTVVAYLNKEGDDFFLKYDVFTNEGADLKSTGYLERLNASQREFIQANVNESGRKFRKHVEDHREVNEEVFRAGWYSDEKAMEYGLVDAIGDSSLAYEFLLTQV